MSGDPPGDNWTCPYCGRDTTLTSHNIDNGAGALNVAPHAGGLVAYIYSAIACPSPTCHKLTLTFQLREFQYTDHGRKYGKLLYTWQVLPESSAKPQPDYIPEALVNDYVEACRIRDLSPKASATLSRRCLQGMIRDFWKTPKKPNLKQEIDAIEDKVDPATWAAIDSVRKVGNIGAHMEQDINLIVEVDPEEAQLLIGLIETLFDDWYVNRHERAQRAAAIVKLAEDKEKARKSDGQQAPQREESPDKASSGQTVLTRPSSDD